MSDQPPGPASDPSPAPMESAWGQPIPSYDAAIVPPYGPADLLPAAAADPAPSAAADLPPGGLSPRKRRWWVWGAVLAVVIIGAASVLFGWVLTRPDPVAFPVGACIDAPVQPVEYGCADSKSTYKIVGREDLVYPVDSACAKYSDATKALPLPAAAGKQSSLVLCLAPTRFNLTDPGALQADDCVDVKNAGDQMSRVDCGMTPSPVKIIAVEMHSKVPVVDQACKGHPQARMAFAQSSLGGRAIVVCGNEVDPNSLDSVKLGDCASRDTMKKVDCADPGASARVLSVRTAYQRPTSPECDDLGFQSVFVRTNDKTDLVLVVCMGPVDLADSRYAVVGDCIFDNNRRSGSALDTHRADCTDPKAQYQVVDRHDAPDNVCPPGTAMSLTYPGGSGTGTTLCMRRR